MQRKVPNSKKMSSVLLEIQPLLNEFKYIVGDDLPTRLPPLRGIDIVGDDLPVMARFLLQHTPQGLCA
jgi:hypothetical protein